MLTLGQKIKRLREAEEINQTELGKRLKMKQRKISYIETDKYEPNVYDIKVICKYFKISADYLLNLPKNMNYPN